MRAGGGAVSLCAGGGAGSLCGAVSLFAWAKSTRMPRARVRQGTHARSSEPRHTPAREREQVRVWQGSSRQAAGFGRHTHTQTRLMKASLIQASLIQASLIPSSPIQTSLILASLIQASMISSLAQVSPISSGVDSSARERGRGGTCLRCPGAPSVPWRARIATDAARALAHTDTHSLRLRARQDDRSLAFRLVLPCIPPVASRPEARALAAGGTHTGHYGSSLALPPAHIHARGASGLGRARAGSGKPGPSTSAAGRPAAAN